MCSGDLEAGVGVLIKKGSTEIHDTSRKVGYQEAYPRFDIIRARAAISGGAQICEFVDHIGRTVGHLRVIGDSETQLTLEYELTSPFIRGCHETVILDLVPTPQQEPNRKSIVCPGCGKWKSTIIFAEDWRCRECHGLCYRSQLVDKYTLLLEKKNGLKEIIGKIRPKGMHRRTYARLRDEYAKLSRATKGKSYSGASRAHAYIVTSSWKKSIQDQFLVFMNSAK
jgi:hypothetical protein